MHDSVTELLVDLPRRRNLVLPALIRIQRHFGYLSADAIEAVAAHLRLTPSDVEGIASGYADLRRAPAHGMLVRLCDGLSCALAGSDELRASLERRGAGLKIELQRVPCLFACALAPVADVGARYLGRATEASVLAEIRQLTDGPN